MASDAAASDDSDLRNIVHCGTPLTATALALGERNGADGTAVLTAMVLGYEAAGRISEAITPGFRNRGFHGCLGAVFAATVAAGHLLLLDAEHLAQAIALSATSIGGLATAADTSVAREYHAGLATMLGSMRRWRRNAATVRKPASWRHRRAFSRRSAASMVPPPARSRPRTWVQAGTS